MAMIDSRFEDKVSDSERTWEMELSKLPHELRIAKCALHSQPAKRRRTGATRAHMKRISTLEIIPETTNSRKPEAVSPVNESGSTEEGITKSVVTNNINVSLCSDDTMYSRAEKTILNQWNDLFSMQNCRSRCPSDSPLPMRTSRLHTQADELQNQMIIKSGAAVLISKEPRDNVWGDKKTVGANNNDTNDSPSCFCCRTPVMLKVYHSSCGGYVVVSPSRHHLGAMQPFCLRLRKCYVSVDAEIKSSSLEGLKILNSASCRFYVSVGGAADGKKVTFEAGSRDSAVEWAKALSGSGGRETPGHSNLFHKSELNINSRPVDFFTSTWCERVNVTDSRRTKEKLRKRSRNCKIHVPSLDDVVEELESQPNKEISDNNNNNKNRNFTYTVTKSETDKIGENEVHVPDCKTHKQDLKLKVHRDCDTGNLLSGIGSTTLSIRTQCSNAAKQSGVSGAMFSSRLSFMSDSCSASSYRANGRKDRHLPTLSESSEEEDNNDEQ